MAILITGASAGFGEAMCRSFVAAGYHVIGAARRLDKLQALADELGGQFYALEMDVSKTESIRNALDSLPENFSEIDCLINNAGLALGLDNADKADFGDWETMIQTNIVGLTFLTRQVLPQMVERNQGYIMNLGSIAGTYPYPGGNVYGATKAFVRQFSLNLRADLAGKNIRVTNIEPGLCGDTEFSNVRFKGDDERAADLYKNVQFIRPQDIADTALWLYQRPAHMNVNAIEIMPVAQTFNPLKVTKEETTAVAVAEESFEKQSTSLFGKIKSWFK
ncbi:NAD(P)-dependent oxidoreductase [Neisseria sp. N95_16]|uniref:SDR family NAD(P)-dependent oxidoreductase n=1 Tax=Neisseria brasiliensis TaxID=2666100 RepID=A0A5Q3RV72_9NEIS|nr:MULTISPECIES: SDR family oxidoreductase [Neisseria]MRN38810.1 SDR family NAD(P)-dependent oxidoreductase [Neisseria brasiliensis]PJO08790.1 NAD(P)-dependent oxidoreductase [Neisseria sp. N95_16]PJO78503.1 NAD(P)-dependent oxidoreductase [Neisseria sp. N177_16]QGL24320.1 SDR family NAD(P)-dependent oxidoreductase [Neisseria brasiliensis]